MDSILVVDDEKEVLELVEDFLKKEGYRVYTARNGIEAIQVEANHSVTIAVVDWMMPGMSGVDVCRQLRTKNPGIGLILLTARSEESDKVLGLEAGADDYITKPFSLRELAARLHSLNRRLAVQKGHAEEKTTLARGELVISENEYRVWKRGVEVQLTPTEFKLLYLMAQRPNIVYSRLQLLDLALRDELLNDERTVDAHISRLRKKIEDHPSKPEYIQTVFGFGYRFGDTK
ncbi:DNA-binding response regulator [Shouchella clausii]|uniref:response regulator transcription factor n=1 Tax=Shouchella tritolerans TaxID=2979466 RepID=UPI000788BBFE|nr:response regulator transcription factor [Shouchella tritolerans]GIN10381.1 DNA-binding response regulator [Shouchella clausii]